MIALVTVITVVLVSLIVTRVATVALSVTGISREMARFQARSALTGVGFTTREAEAIVSHPVRRRIVLALMLIGSAGIVTAIASLIVSFGDVSTGQGLRRAAILIAALFAIFLVARSSRFDAWLSTLIARLMRARGLDVQDYARLLQLHGDYVVSELEVREGDWLADRTLGELRLRDEDVIVLGIHRDDGSYVGVPDRATRLRAGDVLIVYSHAKRLADLDRRSAGSSGEAAHRAARDAADSLDATA